MDARRVRLIGLFGSLVALLLGTMTLVTATSAGAALPTITANGSINCTTLGGRMSFSPPLETLGDSNSETAGLALNLSGCSFTSTNLPAGSKLTGKATATVTTTSTDNSANSCGGLATSRATVQTVSWKDRNSSGASLAHIVSTTVNFSGYDYLLSNPTPGFDLPQDSGGTASASGSFASIDGGALSEANIFFKKTPSQIAAKCNSETTDGLVALALGAHGNVTDPSHFGVAPPPPPLTGVASVVGGGGDGDCVLLTTGGVDCWGNGFYGQLGDGTFYTSGNEGSATPVAVEGVGGTGTLTGVASLVSGGSPSGARYCALLTTGGVDCWGNGSYGQLGDGTFYTSGNLGSATPVAVEGVGGTGTLTGVASLVSDGRGYCALLTSGGVNCWGLGNNGELGDGTFYTSGNLGSATPVAVEGVGGTGTLAGVATLVGGGLSNGDGYCALLTSGGVDCWGLGNNGELGDGIFYTSGNLGSATPVAVEGVGGTGTLTGVASLVGGGGGGTGYCALLTSGGVDCWGLGYYGELGDGTFYTSGNRGSATPVAVEGVGGTGTLTGVAGLVYGEEVGTSYCALLTTGGVDCWGSGDSGQLGDGTFYTSGNRGSAIPVAVEGVGSTGTLSGVASLVNDGNGEGYCALLTTSGVDCWGNGYVGQLGDGTFYTSGNEGSATPGVVEGVGGTGTLTGVDTLVSGGGGGEGYCALLATGGVDCWGNGYEGELGDGTFYTSGNHGSATPVEVVGVG